MAKEAIQVFLIFTGIILTIFTLSPFVLTYFVVRRNGLNLQNKYNRSVIAAFGAWLAFIVYPLYENAKVLDAIALATIAFYTILIPVNIFFWFAKRIK